MKSVACIVAGSAIAMLGLTGCGESTLSIGVDPVIERVVDQLENTNSEALKVEQCAASTLRGPYALANRWASRGPVVADFPALGVGEAAASYVALGAGERLYAGKEYLWKVCLDSNIAKQAIESATKTAKKPVVYPFGDD